MGVFKKSVLTQERVAPVSTNARAGTSLAQTEIKLFKINYFKLPKLFVRFANRKRKWLGKTPIKSLHVNSNCTLNSEANLQLLQSFTCVKISAKQKPIIQNKQLQTIQAFRSPCK